MATVSVNPVNDAPALDASQSPVLTPISEDLGAPSGSTNSTLVSALLGGVTDADGDVSRGLAITNIDTDNGTLWYSITNGEGWIAVDDVSESNALLLHSSALLYWQPSANVSGTLDEVFTFKAWDRSSGSIATNTDVTVGGGTTAFSTTTDTVSVTITAVNDAPTLATTSTTLTGVDEDTATSGTTVSALLTELGYADIEADTGGIAITHTEGAGEWHTQHSTKLPRANTQSCWISTAL